MLHKLSSPFKLMRREEDASNKASSSSSMAVGLGLLVHLSSHLHGNNIDDSSNNNNTVLKSQDLKLMRLNQQQPIIMNSQTCFLKSCFLCSKNLGTDQDIYMYRGDQGFCSEECRNKQIIIDDTRELELSTKKMVAAYRRCSGMSETGVLLDDLRRQNKHIPTHKVRAIFS